MIIPFVLLTATCLACLVFTVATVTLLVSDMTQRRAELQSRIDFKADYTKAFAIQVEAHNNLTIQVKAIGDRISGIEMHKLGTPKK